jgi:hypothetical protein
MPLQIRRGTAAERDALSAPLVIGELLYTTDTGRLYIGDGTALGSADIQGNPGQGGKGLTITGFTSEDAQDAAATLFANGSHSNIFFTYDDGANAINASIGLDNYSGNVAIAGSVSVTGDLQVEGDLQAAGFKGSIFADNSTLLVDAVSGSIPYSVITGVPTNVSSFTNDAGYITAAQVAGGTITIDVNNTGDLQGNVFGDDSTLLVDAINSIIPASVVSGTFTGDLQGSVFGDDSTLLVDAINSIIPASVVSGTFTGDLQGSVFGDDSTLLVDAINSIIPASVVSGTFTGNVVGTVTGTLNGDVNGGNISGTIITNSINSSDSSAITISSPLTIDSATNISSTLIVTDGGTFESSNSTDFPLSITGAHSDDQAAVFTIRRSRGSVASPTTILSNDRLGQINFTAFDGSSFIASAGIQAQAVGTIGTNQVPTSLRFFCTNPSGQLFEAAELNQNGSFITYGSQASSAPISVYTFHNSSSDASNINFFRGRGTRDTPTALGSTDPIMDIRLRGYDGTNYSGGVTLRASVNGAVSTGVLPSKLEIWLTTATGSTSPYFTLEETKATFAVMPVLPTYADDTAADAAIGGAGNRVNGMMFYNTALGTIRTVIGGSWASLTFTF